MGRYYEVTAGPKTWSSAPNGQDDPGALSVQFDIPLSKSSNDMGAGTITIDGISLADLEQAAQFAGQTMTIKAGMTQGLPLASAIAGKAGLLASGTIVTAFGNWIGSDMNINFTFVPAQFTLLNPGNIVVDYQAGDQLSDVLTTTITNAYGSAPTIHLGGSYSTDAPIAAAYRTLPMLASWLKQFTQSPTSQGVDLAVQPDGSILVFDGQLPSSPIAIAFTDLIGQPKWIDPNTLQFVSVMRSDIPIGGFVQLPPGIQSAPGFVTQGSSAMPGPLKYQSTFQGNFQVASVRHLGNSRDPDGASWATIVTANPLITATS